MAVSEIMGLLEIVRTLVSRKAELDKQYFDQFIQPMWDTFVRIHEDYKRSFKEYAKLASENTVPVKDLIAQINRDAVYTADLRSELRKLIKYLPASTLKTKSAYLSKFVETLIHYFRFDDEADLDIVKMFAAQAAIAFENQRRMLAISELERIETFKKLKATLDAEAKRIEEGKEPDVDAKRNKDLFKKHRKSRTHAKREKGLFKSHETSERNDEQVEELPKEYFDQLFFNLQSDYDGVADAYFRIRKELLT
jgi:hypothetical protein